jgi:hypothetical protein
MDPFLNVAMKEAKLGFAVKFLPEQSIYQRGLFSRRK